MLVYAGKVGRFYTFTLSGQAWKVNCKGSASPKLAQLNKGDTIEAIVDACDPDNGFVTKVKFSN